MIAPSHVPFALLAFSLMLLAPGGEPAARAPQAAAESQIAVAPLPDYYERCERRWLGVGPELLPSGFEPDASHRVVTGIPSASGQVARVWIAPELDRSAIEWVEVPELLGRQYSAADALAAEAGLQVRYFKYTLPCPGGAFEPVAGSFTHVARQAPPAGAVMPRGAYIHAAAHSITSESVHALGASAALTPEQVPSVERWLGYGGKLLPAEFQPGGEHVVVTSFPQDPKQVRLVSVDPGLVAKNLTWVEVPDFVTPAMSPSQVSSTAAAVPLAVTFYSDIPGAPPYSESNPPPSNSVATGQRPLPGAVVPENSNVNVVVSVVVGRLNPVGIPSANEVFRWVDAASQVLPDDFVPTSEHSEVKGRPKAPGEVARILLRASLVAKDLSWVVVPDFTGPTPTAQTTAAAVPLHLELYTNTIPPAPYTGGPEGTTVTSQAPEAGAEVPSGSTVKVVVSVVNRSL